MSRDAHPYGESERPREERYRSGRPRVVVGGFWAFCALWAFAIVLLTDETTARILFTIFGAAALYLAVRCARVELLASDAGVVYRGPFRTERFSWGEIESFRATTLVDDAGSRACLVIRMRNGRERTIDDVWAATHGDGTPTRIDRAADRLNWMLRRRSTGEEPRDGRGR